MGIVKTFLQEKVRIRNETLFNYKNSNLDDKGRLKKKNDDLLQELLFKKIKMDTL